LKEALRERPDIMEFLRKRLAEINVEEAKKAQEPKDTI
jgi:hypothetical protein